MKNIKSNTLFRVKCLVALMIFTTMFTNCDPDETQEVAKLNNLVMQDEFDVDGVPNPSMWTYDIGDGTAEGIPGWGNNELQYYTARPENVNVENGVLVITAREESFEGASYTSARLTTQNLFERQYGRFEARIKLPWGKGLWPAFWLLGNDCDQNPWPQCGEIDIMEYLGDSPTIVFGSAHGPGYNAGDAITKEYELENDRFDTGFHVFGIEWSPNRINYYVDDVLYQSITPSVVEEEAVVDGGPENAGEWVFNRPFYIIMNIAVGGNLPGAPNAETVFPQRMLVDYVRVYN
ncbi:glycoside hydrolase family 16 protein [Winogradskyella luteola]|uniref:Glycoside hydrolase family 16 protein n=1 Tax=Winogradskyella luteola TaxID=2828330 RepID=A0A9X1FA56_9FLAO|nr:glycoside hydrolase family 16 protein [Winogradskyella luteola]MBV7269398.1 glycoside hydrolase family 16 protein [Winogradskyella luteola]